jgi:hypothetical protein
LKDQSSLARFVKGVADIAAMAATVASLLPQHFESRGAHTAEACEIASIVASVGQIDFLAGK